MIHWLPLLGIAVLVAGFLVRMNPLLVVVAAAGTSALLAGWPSHVDPVRALGLFGKAFNDNRLVSVVWIVLPLIGLLERYGLQARARRLVSGLRRVTWGGCSSPTSCSASSPPPSALSRQADTRRWCVP